jgi:hypothetical protein
LFEHKLVRLFASTCPKRRGQHSKVREVLVTINLARALIAAASTCGSSGSGGAIPSNDLESAETTARLCRDAGRREAASYRLDVTDRAGMQALAARIAATCW